MMLHSWNPLCVLLMRMGLCISIVGVAMFISTGCTSTMTQLGQVTDKSGATQAACPGNLLASSDREAVTLTALQLHIAWAAIVKAREFVGVRTKLLRQEPSAVARLGNDIGLIFDMRMQGVEAENQYGTEFNSYVIFLLTSSLDEVVDVITCTPDLPLMTVHLEFSRNRMEDRRIPFSSCVVSVLSSTKPVSQRPHPSATSGEVMTPKRICDSGISYPETVCSCTQTVPGHEDWGCLQTCTTGCTAVTGSLGQAACDACCYGACYVPSYCASVECITVYPC